MSSATGVWNITGKNPFLVFFADTKIKSAFMSEYTPRDGFGIYLGTKGYKVYTKTFTLNNKVWKVIATVERQEMEQIANQMQNISLIGGFVIAIILMILEVRFYQKEY